MFTTNDTPKEISFIHIHARINPCSENNDKCREFIGSILDSHKQTFQYSSFLGLCYQGSIALVKETSNQNSVATVLLDFIKDSDRYSKHKSGIIAYIPGETDSSEQVLKDLQQITEKISSSNKKFEYILVDFGEGAYQKVALNTRPIIKSEDTANTPHQLAV